MKRWPWRAALRGLGRALLGMTLLGAIMLVLGNKWVVNNSEAYVYSNWAQLPENDVGLVLGTSSYTSEGGPNPHFKGRIAAAVELYQLGKVKHLLVSGANPDSSYNEPRKMWQALTAAGVPAAAISMDFAGLRTFDSMARAQQVFGLKQVTLITQEYHAYRAVFIGKKLGMQPVAYAAPGEESGPAFRPYAREVFARVQAILDIFLLETQPKFLGAPQVLPIHAPVEIPEAASSAAP